MRTTRLVALAVVSIGSILPFVACGSISESTTCDFDPSCGAPTSTQTQTDSGGGVDAPIDTTGCKPGDVKKVDCNTCTCSPAGVFLCTGLACVDSGPPPSKCPEKAPKAEESCTGATHCIYTDPCSFGCDCVDGKWECVSCG